MTTSGISTPGEGSGAGGLCQPPQRPSRWVQGLTIPAQCFTVRIDVHRAPSGGPWCFAFDVTDPHTRELLAKVVEPARPASTAAGAVGLVVVDLRGILLELTDPEPF